jgi:hypothetical protein
MSHINNIQTSRSYFKENTKRLHCNDQLVLLFMEIIAGFLENYIESINISRGQNSIGTYNYH